MKSFKLGKLFSQFLLILMIAVFLLQPAGSSNSSQVVSKVNAQASPYKTWQSWWPLSASPFVFKSYGGSGTMFYDRATQYNQLKAEFDEYMQIHTPDYLKVNIEHSNIRPFLKALGGTNGNLPTGNNHLNTIRPDNFVFDYYDDLLGLAAQKGIKVFFYFSDSPYGGQAAYPYSYYSNTGWFWCRPDWGGDLSIQDTIAQKVGKYCMADPRTDAMRHPPESKIGSTCYNFEDHIGGWLTGVGTNHANKTTDGIESTTANTTWQVYEAKDMVFNGSDIGLENGNLALHTPVPSISSQHYRDYLKEMYKAVAAKYKDHPAVAGYFLFQEPTYAHLRENIAYRSGFNGDVGACDATVYDVDYSQAELNRYNSWRINVKGLSAVSAIPYPTDAPYKEFREWNLAQFQKELKDAVKQGDPDGKILLSIFIEEGFKGLGTGINVLLNTVKPDILTVEHGDYFDVNTMLGFRKGNLIGDNYVSEDVKIEMGSPGYPLGVYNYLYNSIRQYDLENGMYVSHWWENKTKDAVIDDIMTTYIAQGHTVSHPGVGHYPHWYANQNYNYTVRYPSASNSCIPVCTGKQCGSNGCGGSCGTCTGGHSCNANGQCTGGGDGGGTNPNIELSALVDAIGAVGDSDYDINGDGIVNSIDFVLVVIGEE